MQYRRQHHLPAEVFDGQRYIVSLTVCTADRRRWPAEPHLAEIVRDEILILHRECPILGFCIMPDHAHLLLGNAGSPLGKIMNRFKGRVSRRVRSKEPGLDVWQKGYWDHVVRKEDGLYATLQYIFLNPRRYILSPTGKGVLLNGSSLLRVIST